MRIEREWIKVKGASEPVEIELKFTRHGPVIYEDAKRLRAYALRWVGMEPGSAGYLASLSLDRASNWKEFLKALERWKIPSENLVYADVDGNIGWQAAGAAPIRRGWSGLLPTPGSSGKYEWAGYLPLSELPRAYNPARHFIATANNKIIPEGYKHEINFDWSSPNRFLRIEEVLSKGARFSVADFERLQHDETSLVARELAPLVKNLKFDDPALIEARDLLAGWDFVLSKDSAAAALYELWNQKLVSNFTSLIVPVEVKSLITTQMVSNILTPALKNPDRKTFGENPAAKRDELLANSLVEAVTELRSRLGQDMKKWRWGALHAAEFKHHLSTTDDRRAVFDLESVARGGDATSVNATGGGANFRQSLGASFREILDLSNWDNSVAINVPGQSGQPGSPHYSDLLGLWAEGKYFPLLFSRASVEKHAAQRLTLAPATKKE
jgi:penicillin amidase